MAQRKISNMLALAVLSLLTERPMHPYEMLGVMRLRELTTIIKVNQSSLYTVIEALQREALIVPVETQREGRYPERTIYATTEAGRAELVDWLRSLIRQPIAEYTAFAAGLAFLGNLSPEEAQELLTEHAHTLQEQASSTHTTIEKGLHLGVDRLFLIEDSYALALQTAKLTFVRQLIQEINDGTLTEMKEGQRVWKVSHPELALLANGIERDQEDTHH